MPEVNLTSFEPSPVPGGDSFRDQLIRRFEPWLTPDLEQYIDAVATMFTEVEQLAFDSEDYEGWTLLFDPDRCPAKALPYLAQFVGERLLDGATEAQMREQIKDHANQRRGTLRSVFLAAQRRLTGQRLVSMQERPGGVVDKIAIQTYTHETPNPTGTQQDILEALPADVLLDYAVASGVVWNTFRGTYATWNAAKAANKTWAQQTANLTGWTSFPRPRP